MRTKTGTVDQVRDSHGRLLQRWRARLTINGVRETVDTCDTEADAWAAIDAAIAVIEEAGADGLTVAQYVDTWLGKREANKQIRDPVSERSRFKVHIEGDPIGKIPLGGLRRGDVKAWVHRVRSKTKAQTTRNVLMILRGSLADALDEGRIRINPAIDHKVRRDKQTERPWTYLTPSEQSALVMATPEPERWIVAFAIGSGLRAGELVTLRLVDLHERDGYLIVRYGSAPSGPTKTGEPRRVELVGVARDALGKWRAPDANPHALVFPRTLGGFRDENHVLRWEEWKASIKGAGITRRVRWHDLRHTCASSLISGWWGRQWSLEQVKAQLGHTSIKTTERYAHLAQDSVRKAAEETASVWPAEPPVHSMSNDSVRLQKAASVFLNRRSESSSLSGGASEIADESGVPASVPAGRLLAVSEALLRAVAEGRESDAFRLADELREGGLTRAIDLAEAVLLAAPARLALSRTGGAP
jgi:integrase